jgi:hypothetical protein
LILKSTSLWKLPTESCFNSVFQSLFDVLEDLIREHFGRFERLEIYIRYCLQQSCRTQQLNHYNSGLIEKEIDRCKEMAHKALLKTLELEKTPLFTQNRRYFDSERAEWLTRFQDKHRNTNNPDVWGLRSQSVSDSPSSFDEEMTVMAEVRAYFEVAYRVRSPHHKHMYVLITVRFELACH